MVVGFVEILDGLASQTFFHGNTVQFSGHSYCGIINTIPLVSNWDRFVWAERSADGRTSRRRQLSNRGRVPEVGATDHAFRRDYSNSNRPEYTLLWPTYTHHMATDTPEDLDALVANEMSAEEIERVLHDHGTAVLSLARDSESYAIPVSYGYDGERCYFVFVGYHEPSTKAEFAAATDRATLTVYDAAEVDDWHSVILRGPLTKLIDDDDWDAANDAIEENAWYPSLFRGADPRGNVDLWALDPEEVTGYTSR